MVRCLAIFAIAILSSGCVSTPAHVPFECPERPVFADYDQRTWELAAELCSSGNTTVCKFVREAQQNVTTDDLAMKQYIKACEASAEIHNED